MGGETYIYNILIYYCQSKMAYTLHNTFSSAFPQTQFRCICTLIKGSKELYNTNLHIRHSYSVLQGHSNLLVDCKGHLRWKAIIGSCFSGHIELFINLINSVSLWRISKKKMTYVPEYLAINQHWLRQYKQYITAWTNDYQVIWHISAMYVWISLRKTTLTI